MAKTAMVAQESPTKVVKQMRPASKTLTSADDFVLLCPSAADSVLAQAALYFLPANYKLRVLVKTFQDIMPLSDDQTIVGRITFGSPAELREGSPLPHHAVIYSDTNTPQISSVPTIVISTKVIQPPLVHDKRGTFCVSPNSPEALASAMLRIARQI